MPNLHILDPLYEMEEEKLLKFVSGGACALYYDVKWDFDFDKDFDAFVQFLVDEAHRFPVHILDFDVNRGFFCLQKHI